MRIVISQRVVEHHSYKESRDALSHDVIVWLENIFPNATLVPLPNVISNVELWTKELNVDGVVLTGGNDMGSALKRDKTEENLISYCLNTNVPIFGICRGLQSINQYYNGSLVSDLKNYSKLDHVASIHNVEITCNKLSYISGIKSCNVNSFHDQGISENSLADDLIPFAKTADQIIEGAYHKKAPIMGVQWHPERIGESVKFDKLLITRLFLNGTFWN